MALWARVQQLHGEALQQVGMAYQEAFPIDVRCALAPWIEEQNWADLDPDNPQHDIYIAQVVNAFFTELENKLTSVEDFLMRLKLSEAANEFRAKYSNKPQQLVRVIKHCLNTEMRIVQHAEDDAMVGAVATFGTNAPKIKEENGLRRESNQESGEDMRKMLQCQEAFVIQYQESSKRQAPNSYNIPDTIGGWDNINYQSPRFTMGGKEGDIWGTNKNPGPGSYNIAETDKIKQKSPAYTMSHKTDIPSDKSKKPGPGSHSPEKGTWSHHLGVRNPSYMDLINLTSVRPRGRLSMSHFAVGSLHLPFPALHELLFPLHSFNRRNAEGFLLNFKYHSNCFCLSSESTNYSLSDLEKYKIIYNLMTVHLDLQLAEK